MRTRSLKIIHLPERVQRKLSRRFFQKRSDAKPDPQQHLTAWADPSWRAWRPLPIKKADAKDFHGSEPIWDCSDGPFPCRAATSNYQSGPYRNYQCGPLLKRNVRLKSPQQRFLPERNLSEKLCRSRAPNQKLKRHSWCWRGPLKDNRRRWSKKVTQKW